MRSAFASIIFAALPALKRSWQRQERQIDNAVKSVEDERDAKRKEGAEISTEADRITANLDANP